MRVRTLLIVNPRATTTTKPVRDKIVRTLAARADIEVVETRHRGDAREIAARAVAEGWDALLVLSGDGTINEAVNGMAGSDVPFGALPAGTANVLANEVGLSSRPDRAAAAPYSAGTSSSATIGAYCPCRLRLRPRQTNATSR